MIYDCYLEIMRGGSAPRWFNAARMVFIPKPSDDSPLEPGVVHSSELRPLTLSNCDQKLVGIAVCFTLRTVCDAVVHGSQRGFR